MFDFKVQLSKDVQERLRFASDLMIQAAQRTLSPPSAFTFTSAAPISPTIPSEFGAEVKENEEWVDNYLNQIEPELKTQAEALLRSTVREAMLQGGNLRRLKEAIKSGKKPKIVRKRQVGGRDPLFFQIGDGVTEEMDEIYLLG